MDNKKDKPLFRLNLTHGRTQITFQEFAGRIYVSKNQIDNFNIIDIANMERLENNTLRLWLKEKNVDIQCDEAKYLKDLEKYLQNKCGIVKRKTTRN